VEYRDMLVRVKVESRGDFYDRVLRRVHGQGLERGVWERQLEFMQGGRGSVRAPRKSTHQSNLGLGRLLDQSRP
jgi:hypothetical protein